ncbi:MAG: hypothetical protein AB1306_06055 [Nitrospirota bacterium]
MKNKSNFLIHSAILLFFLLFFALVYKPLIKGHYLYGDDYLRIWTYPWEANTTQSYISYSQLMMPEGRPLTILYELLIFNKYINSLKSYEAANIVRIFGIIGVGLLAYVLYVIFKANKFRTDHAFLLSILICTLPSFQVYLGWLICLVSIYSVLLSASSFLVMFKAVFKEDGLKKANVVIAVPISIILFVASLCIYQPTAMTYWSFALIPLIMIKNEGFVKKWRLPFLIYFSSGFISMLLYFNIIKIFNMLLHIKFQDRGTLIHGIANIYHRLIWFIKYPLYNSINLWNIYPKEVMLFVSMGIFAGILFVLGRMVLQAIVRKELNPLLNLLCRYLLILVIIPLSYMAHLATMGSAATYNKGMVYVLEFRTLAALQIVVLLLFYWGIMNTSEFFKNLLNLSADLQNKIVTIGLVILTVLVSLLANHNVDKYFAKQHTNEYRYAYDIIRKYGVSKLSNGSKIYVKPAISSRLKGGGEVHLMYGEFYHRDPPSPMIQLALYELGIRSDISIVEIYNYDPKTGAPIEKHDKRYQRFPDDENILKIDMTKMSVKETYPLIYYDD